MGLCHTERYRVCTTPLTTVFRLSGCFSMAQHVRPQLRACAAPACGYLNHPGVDGLGPILFHHQAIRME
jgi:hypothetical protein